MKNKSDNSTFFLLWIILCALVVTVSMTIEPTDTVVQEDDNSSATTTLNDTNPVSASTEILTGVWISYISLGTSEKTEEAFKDNFDKLVADAKSIYATDLFVHVRAFSDAFYDSSYYPWSHYLTGVQGQDPGFDPMQYMIDKVHSEGMKFHAWINPLRVKLETIPTNLSSDNPYTMLSSTNPYYFIEKDGTVTMNPAYKEVRNLVANGAAEIVEKYDVDGIHFDDYFYPYGITDEDSSSYQSYTETVDTPLSLEEWRMANINTMILQTSQAIKAVDENVVFGISPQANLQNNVALGADILEWVSLEGYIDYICPQIYFSYDNPYLGFSESLNEWIALEKHSNLDVYVGIAGYKAGTADADIGTWASRDDILASQYKDSIEAGVDGVILYDVRSITDEIASEEIDNLVDIIEQFN